MKPCAALMVYGNMTPWLFESWQRSRSEDHFHDWGCIHHPGDAAVDRARGKVASDFLTMDYDVLLMIDHDIGWMSGDDNYVCQRACETEGVVGALISKRAKSVGYGARFTDGIPHEVGSEELVKLEQDSYVGMAFTAIHRRVFERMIEQGLPMVTDGFYPFFLPVLLDNQRIQLVENLSEDWSFMHRARETGSEVYVAMYPCCTHYGSYGYTPIDGWGGR